MWNIEDMVILSVSAIKSAVRPGQRGDGGGLFLVEKAGGAKSWIFRVPRMLFEFDLHAEGKMRRSQSLG